MNNLEFYKEEINDIRISYYNKETSAAEDLGLALLEVHDKYAPMSTDVLDWLNHEYQILTEEEWEYLDNVIEPFRNKIIHISKYNTPNDTEYITIAYRTIRGGNNSVFTLPEFESGIMYKCLELNKHYTLAELGLEKVEVCTSKYDY